MVTASTSRRCLSRCANTFVGQGAGVTILSAGSKYNVIPSQASAELDCRLLPGQTRENLLAELGNKPRTSYLARIRNPHPDLLGKPGEA